MCWICAIEVAKNILLALAAITTAIVAILGLNRWKAQLAGKANFELARSLMRSTFKIRNEVARVRAPFVMATEFPKGYSPGGSPKQEADAWAHVFEVRWKGLRDAILSFETHQLEAEALWGSDFREKTEDLLKCTQELFAANQAFVDDKNAGGANFKTDPQFGKRMKDCVFSSPKSNDVFSQKVATSVTQIENIVRPHLQQS